MASSKNTSPANIFAVLGFALLLILAIWSAVQVVKYAPRLFGGGTTNTSILTGKPNISLTTLQTQYKDSDTINLTWSLDGVANDTGGILSFVYECKPGLTLRVYDDIAQVYKKLPCNTPYNMPKDTRSLSIRPTLTVAEVKADLAIVYINQKGEKINDIITITISGTNDPNNSTTSTTTPTTSTTIPSPKKNNCTSKIYGTPDLSISNIKTGYLTPNGYFVQKSSFAKGEKIVLRFNVSNTGDKTTPAWFFNLNISGITTYISGTQPSISPCNGRIYTVSIKNPSPTPGSKLVEVILDSNNLIREKTKYNNKINTYITIY